MKPIAFKQDPATPDEPAMVPEGTITLKLEVDGNRIRIITGEIGDPEQSISRAEARRLRDWLTRALK